MIVKKITYKDFNGVEHTEEHCFHLSKIERMRFDAQFEGGIASWVEKQTESGKAGPMLEMIEKIIQQAHGVRSEDGSAFIKNPEITEKFVNSEAYSEFIASLFEGETPEEVQTKITDFMSGVIGA